MNFQHYEENLIEEFRTVFCNKIFVDQNSLFWVVPVCCHAFTKIILTFKKFNYNAI